ncbi:hypothetical protein IC582_003450 [Cucumis melo]
MPTHDKGKQSKPMIEGETSYDVPLNYSSEFDELKMICCTNDILFSDNLPIAKRRLFERVLKGKGKVTQTENVHV